MEPSKLGDDAVGGPGRLGAVGGLIQQAVELGGLGGLGGLGRARRDLVEVVLAGAERVELVLAGLDGAGGVLGLGRRLEPLRGRRLEPEPVAGRVEVDAPGRVAADDVGERVAVGLEEVRERELVAVAVRLVGQREPVGRLGAPLVAGLARVEVDAPVVAAEVEPGRVRRPRAGDGLGPEDAVDGARHRRLALPVRPVHDVDAGPELGRREPRLRVPVERADGEGGQVEAVHESGGDGRRAVREWETRRFRRRARPSPTCHPERAERVEGSLVRLGLPLTPRSADVPWGSPEARRRRAAPSAQDDRGRPGAHPDASAASVGTASSASGESPAPSDAPAGDPGSAEGGAAPPGDGSAGGSAEAGGDASDGRCERTSSNIR